MGPGILYNTLQGLSAAAALLLAVLVVTLTAATAATIARLTFTDDAS